MITSFARPTRSRALLAGALCMVACEGNGPTDPDYEPILPETWAAAVDNPFFPLMPGTTLTYEGDTEDGLETILVEVLDGTRTVYGVQATAVRDRVYLDGELIEDTEDWFAQDSDGNVWYVGEDSKEIEDGEVVSTEGSWQWGVDGALPGIVMWADPAAHLGEEYRQEYYRGEAEDWAKVVALDEAVDTPFADFTGCIATEDWNALEPGAVERKWYCAGIGLVREASLGDDEFAELVEATTP